MPDVSHKYMMTHIKPPSMPKNRKPVVQHNTPLLDSFSATENVKFYLLEASTEAVTAKVSLSVSPEVLPP